MAKLDTTDWQVIAWQGVTVRVPENWNIGALGGDRKQGYLRIDSAEMPRVEIKWQDSPGFADVDQIVDKYIGELEKKPKKGETPVKAERDIELVSKRKMRAKSLTCFRWRADSTGHGAGWYCERCERMMLVQVMAALDEDGEALAQEIIGTMEDHPRGGWTGWSAYGLVTATPDRFELTDQKLMAGLIEVKVADEGEDISVARWGMAGVALKSRDLTSWARSEVPSRHKGVRIDYEEAEYLGHAAVRITGEQISPITRIQAFVMHCLRKPFPEAVAGLVWHCEDANKIFYVGGLFDARHIGMVDEIAERTPCHDETTPRKRG